MAAGGGWQSGWTGGQRAVHLGDVADFNAQFGRPGSGALRQAHHYSCLAAFYTPDPAVLVLPLQVEPEWTDWLAGELGWGPVEVHSGIAPDTGLAEALAARPGLRDRIADVGLPVRSWGGTGPVVRRFESKAESHRLFRRLAADHPAVRVPEQWQPGSRWRLAGLLRARATAGLTSVVKAPYGVGGHGTAVLTPRQVRAAGGALAALRRLRAETGRAPLLEEFVAGHGPLRDLSFDGVIGPDGEVHPVGTAVMHIEGTTYRGATVGPDAVPASLAGPAAAFGLAVGRALAEAGHRGWYDLDFVVDPLGRLAPTETNLRLTGPSVAFMLAARLGGTARYVRTLDQLPLGARLPQPALLAHLARVAERCAALGVGLLPTIPTAGFDPLPYTGVALWADGTEQLDAAEYLLRAANQGLADPFAGVLRER
ncbi:MULTISPECIES: hypothetical protein [unclassified Kitasatospora]|uniref:hypothetical protein n=1 Tax=unclassified Kitasatospora TaxID=2633591 RepID=UPI000B232B28|nr:MULTISPECIES: hypothetical protein [unclassified Kitasatospora]